MKANINQQPLRLFQSIADYWKRGNIYEFTTVNYPDAKPETHYVDGWRDVVIPPVGENQRYGELIYDAQNDVVTRELIDFTPEEIAANKKASIPQTITPTQGRIQLSRMGILPQVELSVEQSGNEELKVYWEYALSWDRHNSYIQSMAASLSMTEEQLDEFFTEASKIE